jgi:hypothetical protein
MTEDSLSQRLEPAALDDLRAGWRIIKAFGRDTFDDVLEEEILRRCPRQFNDPHRELKIGSQLVAGAIAAAAAAILDRLTSGTDVTVDEALAETWRRTSDAYALLDLERSFDAGATDIGKLD